MHTNESDVTPRTRTRRTPPQPTIEQPSAESIRRRAYELYLEREGAPGDPLADWLRAERELIAEPAPRSRANGRARTSPRKRA